MTANCECHEALLQELREWFSNGFTDRFNQNWRAGVVMIYAILSVFERSSLPAAFAREVAAEFQDLPRQMKRVAWNGQEVRMEKMIRNLAARQDPPPRPWLSRALRRIDTNLFGD